MSQSRLTTSLLSRLHARLGDFWWYSLLLFTAQRIGDVINMFVGLWLVPKYVPQQDLGAILPLTQFVSFIGIPLAIIVTPFKKFLNTYAANGETGKIKSLLRDVLCGTAILAIVTLLFAYFVLPAIFLRMRVEMGMIGVMMVLLAVISSISSIFDAAVHGLRRYSTTIKINMLGAPLRLVTMLIFMPFRALTGYFVGQGVCPSLSIFGSLWALRKSFGKQIKAVSYLKDDWKPILKYAAPLIISAILVNVCTSVDQLVIRHRLSDFESAGYYMLTRFTDISNYFGNVFVVFLFPMVSSLKFNDPKGRRTLLQSMLGTVVGGLSIGGILYFAGFYILGLNDLWKSYQSLANIMLPICILNVLNMLCACLSAYETAHGRFKILWYSMSVISIKAIVLYSLTGIGFLNGILPDTWIAAVESVNFCRLSVFMYYSIFGAAVLFLGYVVDIFLICKNRE